MGIGVEKCVRCGSVGEDKRTLIMACFYAMEETGVPFQQVKEDAQSWSTLRVCKACHSSWTPAIEKWFNTPPSPAEDDEAQIEIFALVEVAKAEDTWNEVPVIAPDTGCQP